MYNKQIRIISIFLLHPSFLSAGRIFLKISKSFLSNVSLQYYLYSNKLQILSLTSTLCALVMNSAIEQTHAFLPKCSNIKISV